MSKFQRGLKHPRYELVPMRGAENQIEHLPETATVTITCSPTKGVPATLDLAEKVITSNDQLEVVPHLAARTIESPAELDQILARMGDAGITSAFLVGGDDEPDGQWFGGSLELAAAIRERDSEIELGSTAYPEGHKKISDKKLREDLLEKQQYVGYVVTQLCYEADKITDWIDDMRVFGMEVPVKAGVPGVVSAGKLLKTSTKVGVGDSISFLENNFSNMLRLILTGKKKQTNLVQELEPWINDPNYNLDGFHIYAFNEIEATEEWRVKALEAHLKGEVYDPNQSLAQAVSYWIRTKIDGLVSK